MRILISYPLSRNSPLYPNTPPVTITLHKSMGMGDSSTSSIIFLSSHAGTHIDLPRHFCKDRESVRDLLKASNRFFPTYCISCRKGPREMITPDDIAPYIGKISDAKALLLRTGFSGLREEDPDAYINDHPCPDPAIADLLREQCKELQLVGMDLISASLPAQRELGHCCHRSFLCRDRPILLLEDAFIPETGSLGGPFTLSVYPFLVDELDGVPVIAFLDGIDPPDNSR